MLGQLNIYGKDKVEVAIELLRMFEPPEGYYLAFSGGKDSICIYYLAKMAGVSFTAHYNHTTVDPPELVRFVRSFPDVQINYPEKTMWQLIIENKVPPTRLMRYCCSALKERGGQGRIVVTGVRWAESANRRSKRHAVEFDVYGSKSKEANKRREIFLLSDNDEKRRMIENCQVQGKHIINPIINWTDAEVWEFIRTNNLPYCRLYDEGFKRLGCIGCPQKGKKGMLRDFVRWPKYKDAYLRTFERMLKSRNRDNTEWKTAEEVFNWWVNGA